MTTTSDSATRRDALARSLCARLCDERRSESDLRRVDRTMLSVERGPRDPQLHVYVAAASSDTLRVHAAIGQLRGAGIEITCTWPNVIAKVGDANPIWATRGERHGWCVQDLVEVNAADVVLFLVPTRGIPTRGAWWEASYGYAIGKDVVFAGDTKQSVFCALGEEFASDQGAIDHVIGVAEAHRLLVEAAVQIRTQREDEYAVTIEGKRLRVKSITIPPEPAVLVSVDEIDGRFDQGGEP